MFVYEAVARRDKALYETVSERRYDERWSRWCADRENESYIVCIGKHGVETPVIYKMMFQGHLLEFELPETDIVYTQPPKLYVKLPDELKDRRTLIQEAIKRAFHEAEDISGYGSLPMHVDDHIFVFESSE